MSCSGKTEISSLNKGTFHQSTLLLEGKEEKDEKKFNYWKPFLFDLETLRGQCFVTYE